MQSKTIVIVGASAAGTAAVKELTNNNFGGKIVWIAAQKDLPFKTTQIDSYLEGKKTEPAISIYDIAAKPKNVKLLLDKNVMTIDAKINSITLDDKSNVHYDNLLLAIGTQSTIPKALNLPATGIYSFRTLSDARTIKNFIEEHKVRNAIVVGLGITGMEVATVLHSKKITVHGVDRNAQLLKNYIPTAASSFLQQNIGPSLIMHTASTLKKIETVDDHVTGAVLENGERIPAELIIFTIGNSINTGLFKSAGVEIFQDAVVVNKHMQTTIPAIYAAGDCALITDLSTGGLKRSTKWKDAEEQGKVAARAMLGQQAEYTGSRFMLGSAFFGFNFQGYGPIEQQPQSYQQLINTDNATYYHLFLLDKNLIKGYLILDKNELHDREFLKKAVENHTSVSSDLLIDLHQTPQAGEEQ